MAEQSRPWMNSELSAEQRASQLVAAMNLDECIQQLNQIPLNQVSADDSRGGLGSVILAGSATAGNDDGNGFSSKEINRLQRISVEESRLGIPMITGRDIIHGHYTVFPIPLGQGASWDADLVQDGSRASAVECAADGVHWTFSPMVDISRDPRWGRMAECYGESVLLNCDLGVAAVHGYQGDDLTDEDSIAACAKHFAGYGAAEGGRDYNTTEISATSLTDIYLPPFEAVTKAGCQTFMTSFNEIGGVPSCANKPLVTDTLRDAWGFNGFVVTDWAAVWVVEHGVAAGPADASQQSIDAGSDMDMCSGCYVKSLSGFGGGWEVSESAVRQAAERILVVKFRLGLFDQPYTRELADRSEHRAMARQAAARCAILLENDGVLPLPAKPSEDGSTGNIAVVGPMAQATTDLYGTWTLDGEPDGVTSIADALQQQLSPAWRWQRQPGMMQVASVKRLKNQMS